MPEPCEPSPPTPLPEPDPGAGTPVARATPIVLAALALVLIGVGVALVVREERALAAVVGCFLISLGASVVLYGMLGATGAVKGRGWQLGGSVAGCFLLFGSLAQFATPGDREKAQEMEADPSDAWLTTRSDVSDQWARPKRRRFVPRGPAQVSVGCGRRA